MSLIAFRRDTEDPDIVRQLADLVGIEERLKMLCLLPLVDIEAVNPETLTPWREELLWRLYVDTYNHLTLEYADERIEHQESGLCIAERPDALWRAPITSWHRRIYSFPTTRFTVRLSRDIRPDDAPISS
jgi:[protein-PII] uridylyltransferase